MRKNNMQLAELQLCIKNISRCIDILDLLFSRRKYSQWNTLIHYEIFYTSQLSKNYINLHQEYDIRAKPDQYTIWTKNVFLGMPCSINTWYGTVEKFTLSYEAPTIITPPPPPPLISNGYSEKNTIQAMFDQSDKISEKQHE